MSSRCESSAVKISCLIRKAEKHGEKLEVRKSVKVERQLVVCKYFIKLHRTSVKAAVPRELLVNETGGEKGKAGSMYGTVR